MQVGSVDFGVNLDLSNIEKQFENIAKTFNNKEIRLNLDFGNSSKQLDLRRKHYRETQNYFKSNPLVIKVDHRELDNSISKVRKLKNEVRSFKQGVSELKGSKIVVEYRSPTSVATGNNSSVGVEINRSSIAIVSAITRASSAIHTSVFTGSSAIQSSISVNSTIISSGIGRTNSLLEDTNSLIETLGKTLPNAIGKSVKRYSKDGLLMSLIRAPFKMVGGAVGGATRDVSRGYFENVGQNVSAGFGAGKAAKDASKKVKHYMDLTDEYLIGGVDNYMAAFVAEFTRSGSFNKAIDAGIPRLRVMKEYAPKFEKMMLASSLMDKIKAGVEVPEDIIKFLLETDMTLKGGKTRKVFKSRKDLENSIDAIRAGGEGSKIATDKMAGALFDEKTGVIGKFNPQDLIQGYVNPLMKELSAITVFIGKIQQNRAIAGAKGKMAGVKALFPKLEEGQKGYLQVIGGAVQKQGRGGGYKLESYLEPMAKERKILPVHNPDSDPVGTEETNPSLVAVLPTVKQLIPAIFENQELYNTALNGVLMAVQTIDPMFQSQAVTDALANILVAIENGVDPKNISTVSYSLGGKEARTLADALHTLGIEVKTLAMAYPEFNASQTDVPNFVATQIAEDGLGAFKNVLKLGGDQNMKIYKTKVLPGPNAHAPKHYFKNEQQVADFFTDLNLDFPDASDVEAFSNYIEMVENFTEQLTNAAQITSLVETGKLDPTKVVENTDVGASDTLIGFLETVYRKQSYKNPGAPGKGATPEMRAIAIRMLDVQSKAYDALEEKLVSLGFSKPEGETRDVRASELFGQLKLREVAGGLIDFLDSIESQTPNDSWWASGLDAAEMFKRSDNANLAVNWFRGKGALENKGYEDAIVGVFESIRKISVEYYKSAGKLTPAILKLIEQARNIPLLDMVETPLPQEFYDLVNQKIYSANTIPRKDQREFTIPVPNWLKNSPGSAIAYNQLLADVGDKGYVPPIGELKTVSYGMSGATSFIGKDYVYKNEPGNPLAVASQREIDAYKKLAGRYSPLMYDAEPGKALVVERVKGRPVKDILDKIAGPAKKSQAIIEKLRLDLEKETDDTKRKELTAQIEKESRSFIRYRRRFNRVAVSIYEQIGRLGETMQEMGVAHGDLASANVFRLKGGQVTSIDLGNAIVNPDTMAKIQDQITTIQRAVIDRTFWGILDPLKVTQAIMKGYSSPSFPQQAERIGTADDLPKYNDVTSVPLGSEQSGLLEEYLGYKELAQQIRKDEMEAMKKANEELAKIASAQKEPVEEVEVAAVTQVENPAKIEQVGKLDISEEVEKLNINEEAFQNIITLLHEKTSQLTYIAHNLENYDNSELLNAILQNLNTIKGIEELSKQNIPPNVKDKRGGTSESSSVLKGYKGQAQLRINQIKEKLIAKGVGVSDAILKELENTSSLIGKSIVEGVAKGVSPSEIEEIALSIATPIIKIVEDEFKIKSPSKWGEDTGQNIVEGFKNGIDTKEIEELASLFGEFKDPVEQLASKTFGEFGDTITSVFEKLKNKMAEVNSYIEEFRHKLEIGKIASESFGEFEDTSTSVFEKLKNKMAEVNSYIEEFRHKLEIGKIASESFGEFEDTSTSVFEKLKNKMAEVNSHIEEFRHKLEIGKIASESFGEFENPVGESQPQQPEGGAPGESPPDFINDFMKSPTDFLKDLFKKIAVPGIVLSLFAKYQDVIKNILISSFQIAVEFEKIANTTKILVGDAEKANRKVNELRASAKLLGLDQLAVVDSYNSLAAAARNTPLEGRATDNIAKGLNQAAALFSLNGEQIQGAYTAVQQIIGKGVVSAEELRGQLAERIPGAFQIAARAMKINEQELFQMMSQGALSATTFMPAFARQLKIESFAGLDAAAQTMAYQLERNKNLITDIKIAIGAEIIPMAKVAMNVMNSGLSTISGNMSTLFSIIQTVLIAAIAKVGMIASSFFISSLIHLKGVIASLYSLSAAVYWLGKALNTLNNSFFLQVLVAGEGLKIVFDTLRTVLGALDVTDNPLFAKQTVWDDLSKRVRKTTESIRKDVEGLSAPLDKMSTKLSEFKRNLDHEGWNNKLWQGIVNSPPWLNSDQKAEKRQKAAKGGRWRNLNPFRAGFWGLNYDRQGRVASQASMKEDDVLMDAERSNREIDETLNTTGILNSLLLAKQGSGALTELKKLDAQIAIITTQRSLLAASEIDLRNELTAQLDQLNQAREVMAVDFTVFEVGYADKLKTIKAQLETATDPDLINVLNAQKATTEKILNMYLKYESDNGPISIAKKFALALNQLEFAFESVGQAAEASQTKMETSIVKTKISGFQTNFFSNSEANLNQAVKTADILNKKLADTTNTLQSVRSNIEINPRYEEVLKKIGEEENKLGRKFLPADISSMIKRYESSNDQDLINVLEAEKQLRQKALDVDKIILEIDQQQLAVLDAREQNALDQLDRQRAIIEFNNRMREIQNQGIISNMNLEGKNSGVVEVKQSQLESNSIRKQIANNQKLQDQLEGAYKAGSVSAKEYTTRSEDLKISQKELQQQSLDAQVKLKNSQQQLFFTKLDRGNEQKQSQLAIGRINAETGAAMNYASLLKSNLIPSEIEYQKVLTDSAIQINSLQDEIALKQLTINKLVSSGFNTEESREKIRSLTNDVSQQQAELSKLKVESEAQAASSYSAMVLDDLDRQSQKMQHLSELEMGNLEASNLLEYGDALQNSTTYVAEFNRSLQESDARLKQVDNNISNTKQALLSLQESGINTPDSRSKEKELLKELEKFGVERAKTLAQNQIDTQKANEQMFSDRLSLETSQLESNLNVDKLKKQIDIPNQSLFSNTIIDKEDIQGRMAIAKSTVSQLEEAFSNGSISASKYGVEIRQATEKLYDLELQLVNVNKQSFLDNLTEFKNKSEFDANLEKVRKQTNISSQGMFFNSQLEKDSINQQIATATSVKSQLDKAFKDGILPVAEYTQEIRSVTQQLADLGLQLVNVNKQSFLDNLTEFKNKSEFDANLEKVRKQTNISSQGMFFNNQLEKDSISQQIATATSVKNQLDTAFKDGVLPVSEYTQEIRGVTQQLADLGLQLVNVNKQSFLDNLTEFKNKSEFDANLEKVRKQTNISSQGMFFNNQLEKDSISQQIATATSVKNQLDTAFKDGVLPVSEYTQEIRGVTQQLADLGLQLVNVNKQSFLDNLTEFKNKSEFDANLEKVRKQTNISSQGMFFNNQLEKDSISQQIATATSVKNQLDTAFKDGVLPVSEYTQEIRGVTQQLADLGLQLVNVNKQSFLDNLTEFKNKSEFDANLEKVRKQTNISGQGMFFNNQLEKDSINQQIATATSVKSQLDKAFKDGILPVSEYTQEIRGVTQQLADLGLQLVNVNKQSFLDNLTEFKNKSEFDANLEKVRKQTDFSTQGMFFNNQLEKDSISQQIATATSVKNQLDKAFKDGILPVSEYTQEIRGVTQQLADLGLQLVNVNKQSFLDNLTEFKNKSEFDNSISKLQQQIDLARRGVTGEALEIRTEMIDRKTVRSQLETVKSVSQKITEAYKNGVISIEDYNQEIRQATQQQLELELQLLNTRNVIDKINKGYEDQIRLLENKNKLFEQEKALHEAVGNALMSRMNKEVEIQDKIKSSLEGLNISNIRVVKNQQQRKLNVLARELRATKDKFYLEEKTLDMAREREVLSSKQEEYQISTRLTAQEAVLSEALKIGDKDFIKTAQDKVNLVRDELAILQQQKQVNAQIYGQQKSVLAVNSANEIKLQQVNLQTMVYEDSLENLSFITSKITKELDTQKQALQSHKDLTTAIAQYKESFSANNIKQLNVSKEIVNQLKGDNISLGLKVELENQLSTMGFDAYASEVSIMIEAFNLETKMAETRIELLKQQQDIDRAMLEIDLQRSNIESKQAVVQAQILAAWSQSMGMDSQSAQDLVTEAIKAAQITAEQGDYARKAMEYNQATELNQQVTDNFYKELESRRAIAGTEGYLPYTLPQMSKMPNLTRVKDTVLKRPQFNQPSMIDDLNNFEVPESTAGNGLYKEAQETNELLRRIEKLMEKNGGTPRANVENINVISTNAVQDTASIFLDITQSF